MPTRLSRSLVGRLAILAAGNLALLAAIDLMLRERVSFAPVLAFYRGAALILADLAIPNFSSNISVQGAAFHAPEREGAGLILTLGIAVALAWDASAATPRQWLALEGSEEAPQLAGLRPGAALQSALSAAGLCMGLAALVFVTRVQAIEPSRIGRNFELEAIGAPRAGGLAQHAVGGPTQVRAAARESAA